MIRRAEPRDAPALASLHEELIRGSLWAELGGGFLRTLYKALLEDPRFVAFVQEEGGTVGGFLAASTDTGAMLGATTRRKALSLAARAWRGFRPAIVWRLLETGRYPRLRGSDEGAESLFCAVRPELRRHGIAAALHAALDRELLERGVGRLIVTTEATNAGAAGHLRALGFEETGRFRFYGKDMVRYLRRLELPGTI